MNNLTSQHGLATAAIVAIVAVVIIAGGAFYYAANQPTPSAQTTEDEAMMEKTEDAMMEKEDNVVKKDDEAMLEKDAMVQYSGAVLAGSSAPLLDFNKADFDAAVNSDKLVVLYFYANWCPICRAEFPKMQAAFNQLTTDQVVAFRVNFNDDETDADEVALAREHGVAYQHTKVIVQNDAQLLKSPETWETSRYLTEINNTLAQ